MNEPKAVGDPCTDCGRDVVEITSATLRDILKNRPVLKSLSDKEVKRRKPAYLICPACDAYALGIEMEQGYPFKDKHGKVLRIHDI
ncbi:hypothetical protein [Geoalkalibacter halelectricus]|uniref:hypothetical protein n=1 Tax=Geoalkalibacter halelectricus TaxID=2847045 RepID=UPI003D25AB0F